MFPMMGMVPGPINPGGQMPQLPQLQPQGGQGSINLFGGDLVFVSNQVYHRPSLEEQMVKNTQQVAMAGMAIAAMRQQALANIEQKKLEIEERKIKIIENAQKNGQPLVLNSENGQIHQIESEIRAEQVRLMPETAGNFDKGEAETVEARVIESTDNETVTYNLADFIDDESNPLSKYFVDNGNGLCFSEQILKEISLNESKGNGKRSYLKGNGGQDPLYLFINSDKYGSEWRKLLRDAINSYKSSGFQVKDFILEQTPFIVFILNRYSGLDIVCCYRIPEQQYIGDRDSPRKRAARSYSEGIRRFFEGRVNSIYIVFEPISKEKEIGRPGINAIEVLDVFGSEGRFEVDPQVYASNLVKVYPDY